MDAIETVRNLESELAARRKDASSLLRDTRNGLGLSLRDVSKKVRMSAAAICNLEANKSWSTKTAAKIARFYKNAA